MSPRSGPVRPRISVRLDPPQLEQVDAAAERAGVLRSEMVRWLVDVGLKYGRDLAVLEREVEWCSPTGEATA